MAVLYAFSIPWYRTAGDEPILWLGLPGWVAVALLCYVGAAFANAVAWLLTDVPDVPEAPAAPERIAAPEGGGPAGAGPASRSPAGAERR